MRSNIKDLTGQQFGRLTVIHFVESKEKGAHWLCKCECGNEKVIASKYLLDNRTKSCGCLRKECINNKAGGRSIEDLTGKIFGLLTALEPTKDRSNGSVIWRCKCQCGNIITASARNLKLGAKVSCGCAHSLGEAKISSLLRENHINFVHEYDVLINDKHRRYDFAIIEKEQVVRLIEFDGPQHSEQCTGYYTDLLPTINQHDNEKNIWAAVHQIPLVRIPYYKRNNMTLDDLFSSKYLVIT